MTNNLTNHSMSSDMYDHVMEYYVIGFSYSFASLAKLSLWCDVSVGMSTRGCLGTSEAHFPKTCPTRLHNQLTTCRRSRHFSEEAWMGLDMEPAGNDRVAQSRSWSLGSSERRRALPLWSGLESWSVRTTEGRFRSRNHHPEAPAKS